MKILWVCSLPLPEMAAQLHLKQTSFGGWLIGLSRQLAKEPSVSLSVLANAPEDIGEVHGTVDEYNYYTFTGLSNLQTEVNEKRIRRFQDVMQKVQPNVIHIFGTEYAFTQEMVMAAEREQCVEHVVISLQGLMKEYAVHYTDDLDERIIHHQTLREKIKGQSIAKDQQLFFLRSRFEEYSLRHVSHVIGRTDWDHEFSMKMNPGIQYLNFTTAGGIMLIVISTAFLSLRLPIRSKDFICFSKQCRSLFSVSLICMSMLRAGIWFIFLSKTRSTWIPIACIFIP